MNSNPPDLNLDAIAARRQHKTQAATDFNWLVYADATFAGLAVLIPVPFVDLAVEELFRRRMPRDIAWINGRLLPEPLVRQLNRRRPARPLMGCLLLPFRAILYLFRNIFRTILYALSVADATENLGYYWHRAFLLDYAIRAGHMDTAAQSQAASAAIDKTMLEITTSPFTQLAQQIISDWARQLVRLRTYIRYLRTREESERVVETRETMATAWKDYRDYLLAVGAKYDANFALLSTPAPDAALPTG